MRAVGRRIQADLTDPVIDQARILARRDRSDRSHAAREQVIAVATAPLLDPPADRLPGLLGDLELDRMARLLLHHGRAGAHRTVQRDIADLEADEVAAAELAVDGEIEHRQVAGRIRQLKADADSPDMLGLQRSNYSRGWLSLGFWPGTARIGGGWRSCVALVSRT